MKNSQLRDGGGDPPAGRNAERDFRSEWRSKTTRTWQVFQKPACLDL